MSALLPHLLDLDGTLADTLADIRASTNHLCRRHGRAEVSLAQVRSFVGDGALRLLQRALPGVEASDGLWQDYCAHHIEQCTKLVRPYPGVMELLARWHADGRPLAVVTNKPAAFAERVLAHLDMARFFGAVICGDSLAEKKPSPLPLREALRRLGGPEDRGVMIGDGLQDIRAAKAAGLSSVACLYGYREPDELRAEQPDCCWVRFGGAE